MNGLQPFNELTTQMWLFLETPISQTPDKISKIPSIYNFLDFNIRSLYAKLQLSGFKTKGGV